MTKLKILSVNCRGLADRDKRKDVFHFLRDKNALYIVYRILISLQMV